MFERNSKHTMGKASTGCLGDTVGRDVDMKEPVERAPKEVGRTVGKSSVTLESTHCHDLNVERNTNAKDISGENEKL